MSNSHVSWFATIENGEYISRNDLLKALSDLETEPFRPEAPAAKDKETQDDR